MLNRILPGDFAKFKRITLKKTIPKLIELTDKLETAYKESSETLTSQHRTKQVKSLEKKAQMYMRELLMSKIIADFLVHFHLTLGNTSSSLAKKLTHEYIPFALELHAMLPQHLNLALYHLIIRLYFVCKNQPFRPPSSFAAAGKVHSLFGFI